MLDFAKYGVDPIRGFLPAEDPLTELPPEFVEWDRLGAELPYLLLTGRVRSTLANMTTPDLSLLTTKGELERAMLVLSCLGMAYIWGKQPPIDRIPAALAVLDPNDGITGENLACIQHFLGGMDEQWFFTATAELEAVGAVALLPLVKAKTAALSGNVDLVMENLKKVWAVFEKVNVALLRIYERCDPHIFYYRIRPFLAGWDKDGLLFEGVSETPIKLNGASAAQSSLIQAYDAGLGTPPLCGRFGAGQICL